jgi:hypothetical protein
MVTLFSQGDYDFVMQGGPWIYKQNALLLKDFDHTASPSETVLDSVPVWVRIYDVPWGKQNELWGMGYGNGLGKAMEVDVPSSEQDMNEFLRVRVALPYNRRLQTQLATGVKGKPGAVKVYKLKYERVPYYCSHCGFMGHKKDVCEKRRQGVPSLEYEAYEIRCNPYKKYEYRTHFVPPRGQASARRGMSFASFGSTESSRANRPTRNSERNHHHQPHSLHTEQVDSHSDLNIVPPLEDIVPGDDLLPVGARDGFEEQDQEEEPAMEQNLLDSVEAMQMEQPTPNQDLNNQRRTNQQEPIIQFPEEEYQPVDQTNLYVHPQVMEQMRAAATSSRTRTATGGPNSSDMIPPMRGLSNLHVSFGSAADVEMLPADRVLGKRAAGEEEEVQGQRLELSLGLNYGGQQEEHN